MNFEPMKTTQPATHTPLPWRMSARSPELNQVGVCSADGLRVTDFRGYGNTFATDDANARMIVRAVNSHAELVAALTKALSWAECYARASDIDTFTGSGPLSQDCQAARAALAGAKGGQL